RRDHVDRRQRLMTGVNIFPLLGGDGVEVEPIDRAALAEAEAERLVQSTAAGAAGIERLATAAEAAAAAPAGGQGSGGLLTAAVALAESGARIDEIAAALAGQAERFEITPPRRH